MQTPSEELIEIAKGIQETKPLEAARLQRLARVVHFLEDSCRRHCHELLQAADKPL